VSVLEGGYSDKALLSGAMAHITGLVDGERTSEKDTDTDHSRENWWTPENVLMVRVLRFGDKDECGKTDRSLNS
jgi:histone deacetylase HOS3